METKKCIKCQEIKLLKEFSQRRDNHNFRNECKKCRGIGSKKWADKNRDKTRLATRKYYQKNKEKCNSLTRMWEKNNPDKVRIMRIKNAKNNPETKGYLRHKFCANSRNFIPLSKEIWLEIVKKPCFYCGKINNTLGIDRVDNNIGYTQENAVSCCWICNRMKMNSTVGNFIDRCRLISEYQEYKKG